MTHVSERITQCARTIDKIKIARETIQDVMEPDGPLWFDELAYADEYLSNALHLARIKLAELNIERVDQEKNKFVSQLRDLVDPPNDEEEL